MRLADANLLLYAMDSGSPHHDKARRWLEAQLSSADTFAFAWSVLLAFLRLSTSGRVFESPLEVESALGIVEAWLAQPNVTILHPTDRHLAVLSELLRPLGSAGNLVTDAHLAALAIEHGAELCSSDHDFSRFAGLRWLNPLN